MRTVQRPVGWPTLAVARLDARLVPDHLHAAVDGPAAMARLLAGPSCKILGTLRGGVAEPG